MNLENPPEIADGGYWYVLNQSTQTAPNASVVDSVKNYCAWDFSSANGPVVVVRTLEPLEGVEVTDISPASLFTDAKPRARIGGR